MKIKLSLLSLVALVFIASSCGNAEMEKRMANLETRVNQLENGGIVRNNGTLPAQTVSNAPEQNVSSNAAFKWDQTLFNFGNIQQGEVVNHTFKFTNTGSEPITIQSASASCGCTVPTWSKDPIAPGASTQIVVKYDTKRPGPFNKQVTITSNAVNTPSKIVKIKGTVKPNPNPPTPAGGSTPPTN